MSVGSRTLRRIVTVGLATIALAACGGGTDETVAPTDSSAGTGSELEDLHVEVRRDPG